MATKKFFSQYTAQEIEDILHRADKEPIVLYYDKANKLYRGFASKEKQDLWISDSYQYADLELFHFIAPAPYNITASGLNEFDNKYILEGQTGNYLTYTFMTQDGNGKVLNEGVSVTYTFSNEGNSITDTNIYANGTEVHFNIDKYLRSGKNDITIQIKGRTSQAIETVVITCYVVKLSVKSNFNVNSVWDFGQNIDITYQVEGAFDKHVEFYIDGVQVGSDTVLSIYPNATRTMSLPAPNKRGKCSLQVRATMEINNTTYSTKTLYYEFVVKGDTNEATISYTYPMNTILVGEIPTIQAERYVTTKLNWGFYNADYSVANTEVSWYLENATDSTLIKTLIVPNDNLTELADLTFVPELQGEYHLVCKVGNKTVASYNINILPNSMGIGEITNGLQLKLSGLGRSNSDPDAHSWTYKDYTTRFKDLQWNTASGWNEDALWLNYGATAEILYKPLSFSPQTRGCTIEIEFETYNVDDDDAEVISIDNGSGGKINITATQASLRPTSANNNNTVVTRYKNNERLKLAFVIFPNNTTLYDDGTLAMIINNGILERTTNYETNNTYDSEATIKLGNAQGKCGVKIYNIRCYTVPITEDDEFSNYIIDTPNTEGVITDNDIYADGTLNISLDKMQQKIDCIIIDGDVEALGQNKAKTTIKGCRLERISPKDPTKNFVITNCTIRTHGQSTLGTPVPSIKFWSDKDGSILYDDEGNEVLSHRYAFKDGALPAKKWVLQANYQDSSGVHNGGLQRLITDTWYNADVSGVNGGNLLRTPPQKVAATWKDKYGLDFPYKLRVSPDSLPCVVFYRKEEKDQYKFLGQYVLMDDKKTDFLYGERSIYSNPTDPFLFNSSKKDADGNVLYERLWDNSNTMHIEVLRNTNEISMFHTADTFWNETKVHENPQDENSRFVWRWEQAFEFIYPDPEDIEFDQYQGLATIFKTNFVDKLANTYKIDNGGVKSQAAFEATAESFLDLYKMAAYYIYLMRFGLVDNVLRNAQIKTYDGIKWWFESWDMDIACGLRNDGRLMFDPCIDRDSTEKDNPKAFCFGGRTYNMNEEETDDEGVASQAEDGDVVYSCWLWDALENWSKFKGIVAQVAEALYKAGLTYDNVNAMFDGEYADKWCERIYNQNGRSKYINEYKKGKGSNYLANLQGKRETHRHWWLKTSFDYWDAKWVVGDYTNKQLYFRTAAAPKGSAMKFKSARDTYFGWGYAGTDGRAVETGIKVDKGNWHTFYSDNTSQVADPFAIYQPIYIEEIDLSDFAPYIELVQLDDCYDPIIGTNLKSINIGVSTENMKKGLSNKSATVGFTGMANLNKLEKLNLQGLTNTASFDFSNMNTLKELYLGNTGVVSFSCADGTNFDKLYLNDKVEVMTLKDCSWTDIKFMDSSYNYTSKIPTSLKRINFTNMGANTNVINFVKSWLDGITNYSSCELIMNGMEWMNTDYKYVEALSKLPKTSRDKLEGFIQVNRILTAEETAYLTQAFGENIFNINSKFYITSQQEGFVITPMYGTTIEDGLTTVYEGESVQFKAVHFPLQKKDYDLTWIIRYGSGTQDTSTEYRGLTMNMQRGLLTTTETAFSEYIVNIVVLDAQTGQAETLPLQVKKRTYPTSVFVRTNDNNMVGEDIYLYTTGTYNVNVTFDSTYNNARYKGTIKKVTWDYPNTSVSRISDITNTSAKITVDDIEGEYIPTLSYQITFNNSSVINKYVKVHILKMTEQALLKSDAIGGNSVLFNYIESLGLEHKNAGYYTSLELAQLTQDINITSDIKLVNFQSGEHNVLSFLANVPKLTLQDNGTFTGTVDVRGMKKLTDLIVYNTTMGNLQVDNPSLKHFKCGGAKSYLINNLSADCTVEFNYNLRPTSGLNVISFSGWKNGKMFDTLYKYFTTGTGYNADKQNVTGVYVILDGSENVSYPLIHFFAEWVKSKPSIFSLSGTLVSDKPNYKEEVDTLQSKTNLIIQGNGYYITFKDNVAKSLLMSKGFGDGYGILVSDLEGHDITDLSSSTLQYIPELRYFDTYSGMEKNYSTTAPNLPNCKLFVIPKHNTTINQSNLSNVGSDQTNILLDMNGTTKVMKYQGSARVKYMINRGNAVWWEEGDYLSNIFQKSNGWILVNNAELAYELKMGDCMNVAVAVYKCSEEELYNKFLDGTLEAYCNSNRYTVE